MTTRRNDPILDSLDRLASLADADVVGDRMPDIERRVRVARRRKGAGLALVAAAVVTAGGLGVWQGLPSVRTAPPVTGPGAEPWQEITIDARPDGPGLVRISFTVTGEASAYTDTGTGEPSAYAGPKLTDLSVDGRSVATSQEPDVVCRPGGEPTPYTRSFHVDDPLVVPVTLEGDHTVTVTATYCADGELVDDSTTVTLTNVGSGFLMDRARADLDADKKPELLQILQPDDIVDDLQVRVEWGTGETTTATLPNTMETSLLDPIDLDGDGDLELVTFGGGGETSVYTVFQADPEALRQVRTVDAGGKEVVLASGADPTVWRVHLRSDEFVSYRLVDPAAIAFPAPAEVRGWTLEGDTLTESEESVTQCVTFQPTFVLGPC